MIPTDDFDVNDPKNLGRPLYWRLDQHILAVEQLIRADEIQMALQLADHVPGWWRDNYPQALRDIKARIYQQTYDQIEYATDDEEANCGREFGESQWDGPYMYPRAEIIAKIVSEFNSKGFVPWIFDLGCSHGNLPLGLIKDKHTFDYLGVGMNYRIQQKVKGWAGSHWKERPTDNQPTILYNTEVLEHCMNPLDIVHSAYKVGVVFDQIILSVPMYCLGGGLPDWQTRRMGHVRNWTPTEFLAFADKHWPGYKWVLYKAYSMVLHGTKL